MTMTQRLTARDLIAKSFSAKARRGYDPAEVDAYLMDVARQVDELNLEIDRLTNERTTIRPEPMEGESSDRWNWDTPMMLSAHDPQTIYVGAQRLYRSSDRGHTWQAISPDLTSNTKRDELAIMGVKDPEVRIARNDGLTDWSTLVTIAESPARAGVLSK